jgi:hypothetical protein
LTVSLDKISKIDGQKMTGSDIAKIDGNSTKIENAINNLPTSTGSTVTTSITNGNIKINGNESVVYTHPTGTTTTNPHGTTSTDVGLGNVTNESKITMFDNPTFIGTVREGDGTIASGDCSHAGGNSTVASGDYSRSEGNNTTASGICSYSGGDSTTAGVYCSHVIGRYNKALTGSTTSFISTNDVFVIGNGTGSSTLSNAFRVNSMGATYALSAFNSTGADLAEFAEWQDNNTNNEDRVGYFVTTIGKQIKKATENDYVYGVISGSPCLVGNSDNGDWNSKYIRDNFNRIIYEDTEEEILQVDEKTGETTYIKTGNIIKNGQMKLNPDYDNTKDYISREDRPEWDYVCKRGMIPVRDDGTCVVNKWCNCNKDGLATLSIERSFDTFMVLERITDNIVLIEFR